MTDYAKLRDEVTELNKGRVKVMLQADGIADGGGQHKSIKLALLLDANTDTILSALDVASKTQADTLEQQP